MILFCVSFELLLSFLAFVLIIIHYSLKVDLKSSSLRNVDPFIV